MARMSWRGERSPFNDVTRLAKVSLALAAVVSSAAGAQSVLPAVQSGPAQPLLATAQGEASVPPDAGLPPLPQPQVKAASAIIVDVVTGQVVWEKNSRVRRPMASTTKIMTATLVLESGRLDDTVTFSQHARATPYANLNAKPGERFKMMDLLYAIMLRSSNDSCVAVGEHLSGAAWKFAAQMTARARELGAADTNFVTTNGLYHKDHYSTAYDLALMARHAMQYPLFNEVVGTKSKTIGRSLNWKDTLIRNHNKFLSRYDGADGVKTGYVRQSGRCLVASATRPEQGQPWRLVTVVLNSADTYGDSERMMDWARQYYQPVFLARAGEAVAVARVQGGKQKEVPLLASSDLRAVVRRDLGNNAEREIRALQGQPAPIAQNQVSGQLVGLVGGREVARVDLVAAHPVGQAWTVASAAPWTGGSLALGFLLFGPRYVRAIAKTARRRRRRLAQRRRDADRLG